MKAKLPMDFTEKGIVIFVIDVQSQKRNSAIVDKEEGISICFSDEHSRKAEFPIDVTDEGNL